MYQMEPVRLSLRVLDISRSDLVCRLDEEELRGAYRWILRALSRVSPGEADYVISHDLMQKLEVSLRRSVVQTP